MRLISCGSKKLDRTASASDLYQGSLFKLARSWAEQSPDGKWAILSAKWGMLMPDTEIAPYDMTFNKAPNEWVTLVLSQLPKEAHILEVAAPKRYVDPIAKADSRIIPVLRGVGGIGCQMKWLKENTK